jgi:hypothetical protein
MATATSVTWPSRWERLGLDLLVVVFGVFGAAVEIKSAFLKRPMGDLGVFLRAAWAVRTGNDLYAVTFNGFHYSYPPFFAIFLAPLADPPPGFDTAGMVPYAFSVAAWYLFSLLCLALAVHWLAVALEQSNAGQGTHPPPRGCRRWWALRLVPIVVCLVSIGHTLMRGQVNLLVLALLCGCAAATVRGRRFLAGLALSGAICIKIFPAFLLLYPLWRRDVRGLAGCALGLFVGLAAVPAAVFGPERAWDQYRTLGKVLVGPALGAGKDDSRARELINVTATDSQSLLATIHNTVHLNRWTRPPQASRTVRLASWLIGGALTLLALLAAGRKKTLKGPALAVFFGVLVLNMILLCPVCHLHYFCFAVPLVMGLMASGWEQAGKARPGWGMVLLLGAFLAATIPPQVPGCEVLRDCGLSMYAGLLLWAAGVVLLWKQGRQTIAPAEQGGDTVAMAA